MRFNGYPCLSQVSFAIKKFDRDRACFTRQGDYLVLEIPNLAESRPSLIVGDKLIASEITDVHQGQFRSIRFPNICVVIASA